MKRVKVSTTKEPTLFKVSTTDKGVVTRIEASYNVLSKVETRKNKEGVEEEVTVYVYTYAFDNRLISNRDKLIAGLIRLRYSSDDEFGILRQKETKSEEFNTYYEYVEACKSFATEVFASEAPVEEPKE